MFITGARMYKGCFFFVLTRVLWDRHTHTVQTFDSHNSRPDVCQCLVVQTPMDNVSRKNKCTSMTHVPCESELGSVVRSSMHPYPGNLVAIGRADVYYARASSAGIKCRHCTYYYCYHYCYYCYYYYHYYYHYYYY